MVPYVTCEIISYEGARRIHKNVNYYLIISVHGDHMP